jgi:hypothetical protein
MTAHVLAHLVELPRLVVVDWLRRDRLGGRRLRRAALGTAIVAGLVLALVAGSPLGDRWQDHATARIGLDAR